MPLEDVFYKCGLISFPEEAAAHICCPAPAEEGIIWFTAVRLETGLLKITAFNGKFLAVD